MIVVSSTRSFSSPAAMYSAKLVVEIEGFVVEHIQGFDVLEQRVFVLQKDLGDLSIWPWTSRTSP